MGKAGGAEALFLAFAQHVAERAVVQTQTKGSGRRFFGDLDP